MRRRVRATRMRDKIEVFGLRPCRTEYFMAGF